MVAALALLTAATMVVLYAYLFYPAILWLLARGRPGEPPARLTSEWPQITITVPAYNEEHAIGSALDALLATDYPPERRHILVMSDASSDRTDAIVRSYGLRGVQLIRLPVRGGKTAAENAARSHLRGAVVVNTDASVRVHPEALRALIAPFTDPSVGVASGRDVSVARATTTNLGESGYVGYEMWVRDLETSAGGIVGASGCLYASRIDLHGEIIPDALSRDFAAPLVAFEHGYRSISVPDALCFVPRVASVRREYRRKVRTMSRGLRTLYYKRHLLNPIRHGRFAWMLFSHKLARWLVPWAAVGGLIGLVLLAPAYPVLAAAGGVAAAILAGAAALTWARPEARFPRGVAVAGFLFWGLAAGVHAWFDALRGNLTPSWEPTRRELT